MNRCFKVALFWVAASLSNIAFGCTQDNNSIAMVGLDSSAGTVYVSISSSSGQCSCTSVRFTSANTDTQMALSILMAAKLAEKKVRIDFLQANNCNSAYRVYIQ